jgi:hypothetical protein
VAVGQFRPAEMRELVEQDLERCVTGRGGLSRTG